MIPEVIRWTELA